MRAGYFISATPTSTFGISQLVSQVVRTGSSGLETLETLHRNQRGLRLGAALLCMLLPTLPAQARVRHGDAWARENFARAERMREGLNGRPAQQRTRRDYQRVIDSYRRIYFGAPSSSK